MDLFELFRRLITFVVLSLAFNRALAGTIDPGTPDTQYLDFGKQFPSVVRIKALIFSAGFDPDKIETLSLVPKPEAEEEKPKIGFQVGSAVIIKPNWVLTAAHVVNGAYVAVIDTEEKQFALDKIIVHKDFNDARFGANDIALCYSAKDLDLQFYTPLYSDLDEVGQAVTISGYGRTGTFNTGHTTHDDKKRAGHNRIDQVDGSLLVCTPSVVHDKMPLEFIIAPGDSGGGLFIGNKLAGINSFLMAADKNPNGNYGDEAVFTRISAYVEWVNAEIAQHEKALAAKATLAGDVSNACK